MFGVPTGLCIYLLPMDRLTRRASCVVVIVVGRLDMDKKAVLVRLEPEFKRRVDGTARYHGYSVQEFTVQALELLLERLGKEGAYVVPPGMDGAA